MTASAQSASLTADDCARFGPDPLAMFSRNLAAVEERIVRACARAGRARDTVRLLPITKTVPGRVLRFAHAAGIRDFGENKIQEAVAKRAELAELDIAWSIVGHLQTNKVKYIAPFVHCIHSIDSPKLLEEIDRQAARCGRLINGLLQLKIASEESKYGLSLAEAEALIVGRPRPEGVRLIGVMGMATLTDDTVQISAEFEQLRADFLYLREKFYAEDAAFRELSMGMSGDYLLALRAGSTMVRIGSLLFS